MAWKWLHPSATAILMGMREPKATTASALRITIAAATRMKEMTMLSFFQRPRVVRVCSYMRFRFGKLEHVITHLRSLPSA